LCRHPFEHIFPLNPAGMLLSSILLLFGFIWKVFKAGSMLLPWSSLETGSLLLQREALLEVLHSFDGVYHSWQADVIHALWFFALMWWWHATALTTSVVSNHLGRPVSHLMVCLHTLITTSAISPLPNGIPSANTISTALSDMSFQSAGISVCPTSTPFQRELSMVNGLLLRFIHTRKSTARLLVVTISPTLEDFRGSHTTNRVLRQMLHFMRLSHIFLILSLVLPFPPYWCHQPRSRFAISIIGASPPALSAFDLIFHRLIETENADTKMEPLFHVHLFWLRKLLHFFGAINAMVLNVPFYHNIGSRGSVGMIEKSTIYVNCVLMYLTQLRQYIMKMDMTNKMLSCHDSIISAISTTNIVFCVLTEQKLI
jgi:hypothetical protein